MKKVILLFLLFPSFVFSQERIVLIGNVFDGITFFHINEANIYNFSTKKYSFTNKEGNFEILAKQGDTIIISKPAYKQILFEVTQEMFRASFDIAMYYKVVILREVNVYALPSTYEAFKRDFVNTTLSNYYKIIEGATLSNEEKMGYAPSHGLLDLIPGKVGQAVTSPITFLYNTFSRKVKMDRLYQELVDNNQEVNNLPLKYNRDLVTSLTGLSGDELLDFMTFCKFSYYDLVRWSPEYIIVQINKKFGDYEYYKALEEN